MRILLSNDDGIEAKGIEALVKALYKEHEVIVSAPMYQQSGMAHDGEAQPDLVVSGINHGANLATDVLYSGTVGAAMEGYLHDISSVALSLDVDSRLSYDEAAALPSSSRKRTGASSIRWQARSTTRTRAVRPTSMPPSQAIFR
ncbi:5'/3'-nucleotidase SurE [Selenomonas ruminantium]|uniref:5'-nucleotidase n=1 Tax=Selenomonas ruminantium TaxID=971 RepID=A0A1I3D067_SELRU|nr:5'/3'-nucleotidase SurE [Selenomonas ruminantium]